MYVSGRENWHIFPFCFSTCLSCRNNMNNATLKACQQTNNTQTRDLQAWVEVSIHNLLPIFLHSEIKIWSGRAMHQDPTIRVAGVLVHVQVQLPRAEPRRECPPALTGRRSRQASPGLGHGGMRAEEADALAGDIHPTNLVLAGMASLSSCTTRRNSRRSSAVASSSR